MMIQIFQQDPLLLLLIRGHCGFFSRPAGAVLNTHTLFIQRLVSRHMHAFYLSITVLCSGVK